MLYFHLPLALLILILANACAVRAPQNQSFYENKAQETILKPVGNEQQSGEFYQNLAKNDPEQRNSYYLLAAESFLQSGNQEQAQSNIDKIHFNSLSLAQQHQLNLLRARLELSYGNAESALTRLDKIQAVRLTDEQQKDYYRALAFARSLTGELLASAQARMRLAKLLTQPQQISQNQQAIVETLLLLPLETLQHPQGVADELAGWMELASVWKQQSSNTRAVNNEISAWQRQFPRHPANIGFLDQFFAPPQYAFGSVSNVAVLLPESGPFATAAEAIKAGILAAHDQGDLEPLSLRFYDSVGGGDIAVLYQQAVAAGAELVIGPLDKNKIEALAQLNEFTVPVLALNHVEQLSRPGLFQFALSPIDDAAQIAVKALQDGRRRALVLMPQGDSGQRIAQYLADAWQGGGGEVLETQFYNPHGHDFSAPIKSLLNLDESQQRYVALRNFLNRGIDFMPRRRDDVDVIFISASAATARSLKPQLMFYYATDIPVYAMPQVYSGVENPTSDRDLNQITFCDIPWMFDSGYPLALSRDQLHETLRQFSSGYYRLIAMGIDAYNLIDFLKNRMTDKYHGVTGLLSLNHENRVVRELMCAKFVEGLPVAEGFVEPMDEWGRATFPADDLEQLRPIFYDDR